MGKDNLRADGETLCPGTKLFSQGSEKRDKADDLRGDPESETPRQSSRVHVLESSVWM